MRGRPRKIVAEEPKKRSAAWLKSKGKRKTSDKADSLPTITRAPSIEWIFDKSPLPDPHGRGTRAVKFLKSLKHPKSIGKNQAFELVPWMSRIVERVYGDTNEKERRKIKTVFLLLPRGNRKTTLGAGLALLHLVGPEKVPSGQVISAAIDRKQARIAYVEAKAICALQPELKAATHILDARNTLQHPASGATYEAISAEAGASHGRTPNFILADELHAWPKPDLWDVLRTGAVKSAESLTFIITTAGIGRENIAYELYSYAKKVASGAIKDPGFLPILFETDAKADWQDEAHWFAANPGLEYGFPDLEAMRQLAKEAEARPRQREAFRQLHLNVWMDGSASGWIDLAAYDENGELQPLDEREDGEPCWIGVDLSSTQDLTAVVAVFREDDGSYSVYPFFYLPEAGMRRRADRDGIPFPLWVEEGLIIATRGDVVDYDEICDKIAELATRFDVREIAMDPWNSTSTQTRLLNEGLPVVLFRQGFASMSPAMKEVERAVKSRKFRHGDHPVLRWNMGNMVADMDPAGNVKPSKARSSEKIDGIVAAIMAIGRASQGEGGGSVYDSGDRPDGFLVF